MPQKNEPRQLDADTPAGPIQTDWLTMKELTKVVRIGQHHSQADEGRRFPVRPSWATQRAMLWRASHRLLAEIPADDPKIFLEFVSPAEYG